MKQNLCKSTSHSAGQAMFKLAFAGGCGHLRTDPFSWASCASSLSGCYRAHPSCHHSGQISSSGPISPAQAQPQPGSASFPFQLQKPNSLESFNNRMASYKEGWKMLPEGFCSSLWPPSPGTWPRPQGRHEGGGNSPCSWVYIPLLLIPRSPTPHLIFTVPPHWGFLAPSTCLMEDMSLYALDHLD